MQNPVIGLIVMACLSAFEVANAAYLIRLKNGHEFVTSRYWQDGKQILFETYNGTFGVDQAFVARVEKSDQPIRLLTSAQAAEEIKPAAAGATSNSEVKNASGENQQTAPAKRNEDDPILRHFQSVKERASKLDGMLTPEVNQLAKDLQDIKRAMQLGGKTNEFLAEFTELHNIFDRVEDALKARR